jgi:hypothetical protein
MPELTDHIYCSSRSDVVACAAVVLCDHNYTFPADHATAPPHSHLPSDESNSDVEILEPNTDSHGAPDPELEDLKNMSFTTAPDIQTTTPAAAWVLTTLLLLSMMQKTYTGNVIGEVAAHLTQGRVVQEIKILVDFF